jgi:oligosaccharide repeat unit polymerase
MLLVSTLGILIGLVLGLAKRSYSTRAVRVREANWLLIAASAAALIFFAKAGIPILQQNAEAARVTAASTGTGYFRLLAYMSIPAGLTGFIGTTGRRRLIYVAAPFIITVAVGNRSPLVYLIISIGVAAMARFHGQKMPAKVRGYFILSGLLVAGLIASLGAYRITSGSEFQNYQEYSANLAEDNYLGIAKTALFHYAETVPSNAVLVKRLVDNGDFKLHYGSSYLNLFTSALPGQQLTLDLQIKQVSGKSFVGGGIPPTAVGEGYANFGWIGVLLNGIALGLAGAWVARLVRFSAIASAPAAWLLVGYMTAWCLMSQVSGFVGASTFPMAGFLVLLWLTRRERRKRGIAGSGAVVSRASVEANESRDS